MPMNIIQASRQIFINVKCIIWMLFKSIVLESFEGFTLLYTLFKQSVDDEEIKGLIEEIQPEFLEGGKRILLCASRSLMFTVICYAHIFLDSSNEYYFKLAILWPIYFSIVVAMDKLSQRYK